jgi:hypothetical protein
MRPSTTFDTPRSILADLFWGGYPDLEKCLTHTHPECKVSSRQIASIVGSNFCLSLIGLLAQRNSGGQPPIFLSYLPLQVG